ncbi:hypothetical protein BJF85_07955 [Saccharomonospora sp. CUA-673]|nr:hypothetical protein BJF85_07955 [Saccharomonospora sp. CUA-673]
MAVVVAVFAGWMLRGSGDAVGAEDAGGVEVGVPKIVSAEELEEFASKHYPVYWAGERPDSELEVTLTTKNAIFVRYLPEGTEAGSDDQHLTIATYGDIDGYDALSNADEEVADVAEAQGGAIIATFNERPRSTYFSFQNAGFQVEVFSPQEGQSKTLTDEGEIRLVGGTS